MLKKLYKSCHFIKLEKRDWMGDWRGFCRAIKRLDGVTFNPVELDEEGWWYIPGKHVARINELYLQFIGKVLKDADADRAAGFAPTSAGSGRFSRKWLKF